MPNCLHQALEEIRHRVLALGGQVEEMLEAAVRAVQTRDTRLAAQIIDSDSEIDQAEIDIEEGCLSVLALYQPVATDLRFIVAVLKINNDLERIADLAVNIAEQACFFANSAWHHELPFDLPAESGKVRAMLRDSLDALVTSNVELAEAVRWQDSEVDTFHRGVYEHLEQAMQQNPGDLGPLTNLVNISRRLERIGDHAVNIAEDVIYMARGEIVRHRPLLFPQSADGLPQHKIA